MVDLHGLEKYFMCALCSYLDRLQYQRTTDRRTLSWATTRVRRYDDACKDSSTIWHM